MRRVLFSLALLAALAPFAGARAGEGQSYSGGSSFSGSSSGGGYSYGGGSSGDADFFLIAMYLQWVVDNPLLGIPMTLFLLYCLVQMTAALKGENSLRDRLGGGQTPEGAQLSGRMAEELARLQARDPSFGEGAFLERAAGAFRRIQQAWSDGDMAPVRAFVSDGVNERFTLQLADLKRRGLRNVMRDVNVVETELMSARSDRHFDALCVRLRATAVDTMVDDKGRPAAGSVGASDFEEVWTFLRRPGAKTLSRPGSLEGSCPSCGAPLQVVDAGRCGACSSWVNSGDYDWVLSEITQSCEWTPREADRDVDGWAPVQEADPALNLPTLEDRTSVMFWRWIEARRAKDASILRGVASDDFCGALDADIRARPFCYFDAAVGGVEVVAFEEDGGYVRCHVMVKWSGRKNGGGETGDLEVRRHFFVLSRRRDARTDARAGLRSARCPSCGAPAPGASSAACAYCGKPMNDGARDWVLTGLQAFGDWRRPASGARRATPAGAAVDWGGTLSPLDAFAILANAMLADGEVSLAEKSFLEAYARSRGIRPEVARDVINSAKAALLDVPAPRDAAAAEEMLRGMVRMSLADGVVADDERRALDAFAVKHGLEAYDVARYLTEERASMERAVRGVAPA